MSKKFLVVSFYTKKDLCSVLITASVGEALYKLIEIFREIDGN